MAPLSLKHAERRWGLFGCILSLKQAWPAPIQTGGAFLDGWTWPHSMEARGRGTCPPLLQPIVIVLFVVGVDNAAAERPAGRRPLTIRTGRRDADVRTAMQKQQPPQLLLQGINTSGSGGRREQKQNHPSRVSAPPATDDHPTGRPAHEQEFKDGIATGRRQSTTTPRAMMHAHGTHA